MTGFKTRRRRLRFALLIILALSIVVSALFYWHPLWFYRHSIRVWLWLRGARGGYVQLGPYRVHELEAGAGKPLVLVHGLGGQAEDWSRWIPALAGRGYHVYAIDLLGFGRSDRPKVDYSIAQQSSVLRHFFDARHIRQADLGGWSMGGWIALKFTLDNPDRVRRVFVCDSAGVYFQPAWSPELFSATSPAQLDQLMAILTPHPARIPAFVARDIVRKMSRESWIVQAAFASMKTRADLLDGKLERISQPVLLLWGKEDATTPLSGGAQMRREMPQSLLEVFDGCGHMAPQDCAKLLIPEAARFLEANPPLPSGELEFPPPD